MSRRYIFSSESVTEGHPDKVCDTISDYILDACLEQDPLSRVACETLAKGNLVLWAGEQGLMFGLACNDTTELMPVSSSFAHKLGRELTRLRKEGEIPWLRPDAKTQVSIEYHGHKPVRASAVVVSTQHAADVKQKEIRETLIELLIKKVIPAEWLDEKTTYLINPTGRFVVGGPEGDAGITGRKIIVDSYGGMGRHGGGAFSGKDPSKVDRSAAYMGRWVAKNVVASGLADRCEVQFAYAIGHPEPVSVSIDTF